MPDLSDRNFFLLAVILYGISMIYSLFLWRKGFRQDNRINYVLLLAAFCLHTIAMVIRGFSLQSCPVNNLYEATTFFLWTIVAVYLVLGVWSRLRFLGAFVSPILFAIGVFALMPALDPAPGPEPRFTGGIVSLHASLILLAYGAFGLAATAGLMFLTQEHNLKFNKVRAVLSLLPPVQRLETVTNRLVMAGFVLLTVGLALASWATPPEGARYYDDAKVYWSALLWLLYLGLLIGRRYFARPGRRFAIGTIGLFAFLVLTFWGTNLLSALHQ
ncbi:MAG TPA: cytochrome c biogenesis protein CcsA [Verrucomicrobiota bacterium]|nr:cytochrome c biogenesis protein CcsA [Verrucomicrobiota bacterium]HPU54947.1 cytochrome c biogenesis protein CcsA [Verrucomicrobiota bacterium]